VGGVMLRYLIAQRTDAQNEITPGCLGDVATPSDRAEPVDYTAESRAARPV